MFYMSTQKAPLKNFMFISKFFWPLSWLCTNDDVNGQHAENHSLYIPKPQNVKISQKSEVEILGVYKTYSILRIEGK